MKSTHRKMKTATAIFHLNIAKHSSGRYSFQPITRLNLTRDQKWSCFTTYITQLLETIAVKCSECHKQITQIQLFCMKNETFSAAVAAATLQLLNVNQSGWNQRLIIKLWHHRCTLNWADGVSRVCSNNYSIGYYESI